MCLVLFPRKESNRGIVRVKRLGEEARSSGRRHEITREALRFGVLGRP
ncbi:MAG TPA: hypothetical protein P5300_06720 [Acidobacteriota bacterium]|nr:hypothetical protein [Acidobacteriota bacterium]